MPTVFGLDIAGIVAEAIAAAGGLTPAVLTQTIPGGRDPDNPTRFLSPTTTTHTLEAAIGTEQIRREGSATSESRLVCTIIAGSISPPTVPAVNDTIVLAGITYTLAQLIQEDPASAAYVFEAA